MKPYNFKTCLLVYWNKDDLTNFILDRVEKYLDKDCEVDDLCLSDPQPIDYPDNYELIVSCTDFGTKAEKHVSKLKTCAKKMIFASQNVNGYNFIIKI